MELVKVKYSYKHDKLQIALKGLNKTQVVNKIYTKKKMKYLEVILVSSKIGRVKIADQTCGTHKRFRNIGDFEAYINAIDEDYLNDDAIFNGYILEINTPQFNLVNRSQYGNGCDFKHEIIEYRSINCFIPTKGYCFVKCINFVKGEDYKEQYLNFIGNEIKTIKCYD